MVAYTVKASNGGHSVVLLDLGSRSTRVIATTPAGGLFNGVAASGHWLTWVEQPRIQSDGVDPVSWRMDSYDLRTGRTRTVVRSLRPNPLPPVPVAAGNRVVWADYRGIASQKTDIRLADLATGRVQPVVAGVHSDQVAFDGSTVVYTEAEKLDASRNIDIENLHAVSLDGRHTSRLTRSGTVDLPRLADGLLVWQDRTTSAINAMRMPDGAPRAITITSQMAASPGAGFAADLQLVLQDDQTEDYQVEIVPADNPAGALELPLPKGYQYCVPGGINVQGTRVAWGVEPVGSGGEGHFRIVITDVKVLPHP